LEEIERLNRKLNQNNLIFAEKDNLIQQLEDLCIDNEFMQGKIKELEHKLEIQKLKINDSKSMGKSILNASQADMKDLYLEIERYEKTKINLEIQLKKEEYNHQQLKKKHENTLL
jgi:hypothetical protein